MSTTSYGHWLRAHRKAAGITQRILEDRAELGHSHLSKIENGHIGLPEKETRDRIHAILGTSDDDLVDIGLLRKSMVAGASGEARPIYFADEGDPTKWQEVRSRTVIDDEQHREIMELLESVELGVGGRYGTLKGILETWLRVDQEGYQ